MLWNKSKNSVQELLGVIGFTRYGLLTVTGERVYFRIAPTNISVLSEAKLSERITKMTEFLKAYPEIETCCVDAAEDYDSNKAEYRRLCNEESNPIIRDLLDRESESGGMLYMIIQARFVKPLPPQPDEKAVSGRSTQADGYGFLPDILTNNYLFDIIQLIIDIESS